MKHKDIQIEQIEKAEHMAVLMVRYMLETITSEEHDELDEWVAESDLNMWLFEEMTDPNRIANQLRKLVNL